MDYYGYDANIYPFQKKIIEKLEQVKTGKIKRLIINMPPRYRKTHLAVKLFIAFCLAENPKAKFIHLSYADKLALDNSEEIRDIIHSDYYQSLFKLETKKDSKAKQKWYTSEGGGVYATGSKGQVTGFGAGWSPEEQLKTPHLFGGAIIIDDPNKPDDIWSPTTLHKVNYRFDSTISNRLNDPKNTPIIVIQQRVGRNDLTSYLLSREEEWERLILPAIDENGNPLCEQIHTIEMLRKLEKDNKRVFDSQYMQTDLNADGYMYEELITYKEDIPYQNGVNVSITDTSLGGDYWCTWFASILDSKVYVFDAIYNRNGVKNIALLEEKIKLYGCLDNVLETNKDGAVIVNDLISKGVNAKGVFNTQNKIARIEALASKSSYFQFKEKGSKEFEEAKTSLSSFPKEGYKQGEGYDDAPDAFSMLQKHLYINYKFIFQ